MARYLSKGQFLTLFSTEAKTYGAPGNREDYTTYFPRDSNREVIVTDIKLTGKRPAEAGVLPVPVLYS